MGFLLDKTRKDGEQSWGNEGRDFIVKSSLELPGCMAANSSEGQAVVGGTSLAIPTPPPDQVSHKHVGTGFSVAYMLSLSDIYLPPCASILNFTQSSLAGLDFFS